jgi:thioredoxin-related protein
MLRDYMVLVYSVVKSKGVPFELRFCDITKPGMKEMADKYEIKKLPSSVVFDRGGKKLKTLIGASVQQMDGLDGFRSVAAKSTEPAL